MGLVISDMVFPANPLVIGLLSGKHSQAQIKSVQAWDFRSKSLGFLRTVSGDTEVNNDRVNDKERS